MGRMSAAESRSWISQSATARYGFDSESRSPRAKQARARGPRRLTGSPAHRPTSGRLTVRPPVGSPEHRHEVDHVLDPEDRAGRPARGGARIVRGPSSVVRAVHIEKDLLSRV